MGTEQKCLIFDKVKVKSQNDCKKINYMVRL